MSTYAPLRFVKADGTIVTVGDPRYSNTPNGSAAANVPGRLIPISGDGTGATDSTNIQNAIDAAASEGGGIVWLNAGNYYTNRPLTLATGVALRGTGWKTVIHLAKASNCSIVVAPKTAYWYEISNFQVDGHKEDQTGGTAGVELLSDTTPDGEMASCGVPLIERVLVRYTYGHGFYSKAVEARHLNCFAFRTGGAGYYADRTDMWYTDCTSGESYGHGFHFSDNASECHVLNCKAWWPGYGAPRGAFAWKTNAATLLNPNASSYFVSQYAPNQQMINCEAQDAAKHGFDIQSHSNRIIGRAGRCEGAVVALSGNARYNSIDIDCSNPDNLSDGLAAAPDAMIHHYSGAAVRNHVRVTWHPGDGATHTIKAGYTGGVYDGMNTYLMGNPGAYADTTYAATKNPDPIMGGIDTTLTGNITITNPAPDRRGHGMEFLVRLTQDATGGRTVTWGTDFKGVAPAVTTANAVNEWRFRCTKSFWVQTGFVSY